jgi:hypothetical protein
MLASRMAQPLGKKHHNYVRSRILYDFQIP